MRKRGYAARLEHVVCTAWYEANLGTSNMYSLEVAQSTADIIVANRAASRQAQDTNEKRDPFRYSLPLWCTEQPLRQVSELYGKTTPSLCNCDQRIHAALPSHNYVYAV